MKWLGWLAIGIGVLFLVHRVALWAESRGYIYYLNRQPSSSTLGSAFLEVQSILEPDKRELAQVVREEQTEDSETGEPPEPGKAHSGKNSERSRESGA